MYELVSIDTGHNFAVAFWHNGICEEVFETDMEGELFCESLTRILQIVRRVVEESRPEIACERPSRSMPIQWIQYSDIRALADTYKVGFFGYVPPTIKKHVSGNGRASKEEIRESVKNANVYNGSLPIDSMSEHEVDAIACGICYYKNKGQ